MKKRIALLLALLVLLLSACAGAGASVTPPEDGAPCAECAEPDGAPTVTLEPDGEEHRPAEGENVNAEPEMLYCGNTVTSVTCGYVGETYSFWGDDSVALTDLLLHLVYDSMGVCRCPVEYTIDTEFGGGYGVNLTEAFARCADGQVPLTEEQVEQLREIIERNCV